MNKNSVWRKALEKLSDHTLTLLNSLLPLVLAEFIYFAISFLRTAHIDPAMAIATHQPTVEYLMMSLFLVIGSAVVFDIAVWERGNNR